MSANAEPITAARFAAALIELPLSSLFAKGAEIRNSMAHLERSNEELKNYADEGDRDCADALEENVAVIAKMDMRLELLKIEVENRGFNWNEAGNGEPNEESTGSDAISGEVGSRDHTTVDISGEDQEPVTRPALNGTRTPDAQQQSQGRRPGDAELRRLMAERMEQGDDDIDGDGLHL